MKLNLSIIRKINFIDYSIPCSMLNENLLIRYRDPVIVMTLTTVLEEEEDWVTLITNKLTEWLTEVLKMRNVDGVWRSEYFDIVSNNKAELWSHK